MLCTSIDQHADTTGYLVPHYKRLLFLRAAHGSVHVAAEEMKHHRHFYRRAAASNVMTFILYFKRLLFLYLFAAILRRDIDDEHT